MLNMRSLVLSFAAVGFLNPLQVIGQEAPRCFEVVAVDSDSGVLSSLAGDTIVLTREAYSRGVEEVTWRQALLKTELPASSVLEATPWRPIGVDSLELHLPDFHTPAQLVAQDSGRALRGFIRLMSDELGTAAETYRFHAKEISCEELGGASTALNNQLAPPLASLAAENPAVQRIAVVKGVESAVARELWRHGGRVANLKRHGPCSTARGLPVWAGSSGRAYLVGSASTNVREP